jgi:Hemerythrin HHE cation binding domain
MVKDLFARYEGSKHDSSEKELVAEEVFVELEVHACIEEEIFYPRQCGKPDAHGQELVAEAIEEHQTVKRLIQELRTLEPEVEEYDANFKVLSENVEHHAKEEEDEIFRVTARFSEICSAGLGKR